MKIYKVIIFSFLLVEYSKCDLKKTMQDKLKQLKQRSIEMYGERTRKTMKLWKFEFEHNLLYPKGDKQKLSEISDQWLQYYACCALTNNHLTPSHGLPSVNVYAYDGAVARLPCGLCVSPDMLGNVSWVFTKTLENQTFTPMEDKETVLQEANGSLTIYNVKLENSGVYRCEIGDNVGGLVLLEVVDSDKYTVVKPSTSRGPFSSRPHFVTQDLLLFSSWTKWSECSRCGRVGRRRRYGACYVRLVDKDRVMEQLTDSNEKINNTFVHCGDERWHEARTFLEAFPGGIACRSLHLPPCVARMHAVRERRNEIMIAMCKVLCKTINFAMVSRSGRIVEYANNSGGIYSLKQRAPPQPPPPVRDVTFVVRGSRVVVRCPGTTLRDMPVSWRVGTKHVVPRSLVTSSNGRIHINARDMIVFQSVADEDTNLYSCWQADVMAGAVRMTVWTRGQIQLNGTLALIIMVVIAAIMLKQADKLLNDMQRRAGL